MTAAPEQRRRWPVDFGSMRLAPGASACITAPAFVRPMRIEGVWVSEPDVVVDAVIVCSGPSVREHIAIGERSKLEPSSMDVTDTRTGSARSVPMMSTGELGADKLRGRANEERGTVVQIQISNLGERELDVRCLLGCSVGAGWS